MALAPVRGVDGDHVGLEVGVRAVLEAAGCAETVSGLAALDAARALDAGGVSGAARAQLLKEMRSAAEAATKAAPPAASLLDDLRRRRERRTG